MKQISLGKILITPQGEYDSLKTYQYLDVVSHDGASYMAKTDVPEGSSLTNTTYWLQIAAKGSNADIATITSAVNTWLAAHVTQPTTPAIDDTLSITGAAADAAKTGLMIAPIYNNTTTYNLGDIVNYNGSLYRCISTITTAEDWNNNHWIATKMADEVGDLKSANNYVIKTEFSDTFEAVPFNSSGGFAKGRINTTTGANASSTTRARRYNSIFSGNYVSLGTNDYEYTLFYYDGVGSSWADTYTHVYSDWIKGSIWTLIDDSIGDRARMVVRHPDDSEISDTDLGILTRVCASRDLDQITPQITTKKGNPACIGELEALARDWYSHRNDIVDGSKAMVYGNNSILNTSSYTREIDCSTFVGMLLRGYSFSQTPYATGQGASPDSWTGNTSYNWTFNPFDYSNYSRIDSQFRTKVRYASQMAEMMVERGQTVPIDRYYANIESGDVLFFARQDETTNDWFEPLRFKHINHVAICIAKEKATSANGWDTATYPWKHTFAEVGHEDETTPDGVIKIRTLEQPQGDTSAIFENNINTLCLVCRPDLGSISDDYTELSEDVAELQSAFNADLVSIDWTPNIMQGSYFKTSNGAAASSSSNTYARTSTLWQGYGTRKAIVVDDPTYEFCLTLYDKTGTTSGTGYQGYIGYSTSLKYIPKTAAKIGVTFRRVDQAELTDEDITAISAALSALAATDTTLSVAGAPADAKATGDMFSTAIVEKDSLPANTDLNSLTDIGLYWIPNGNSVLPTLINYPSSNSGRLLVLSNEAGNFCTQIVITSDNVIFTRIQTSAANHTWTEWVSYDYTTVRNRARIYNENGVPDANEHLLNGIYGYRSADLENAINFPSPSGGNLFVYNSRSLVVQIYVNLYGTVYYRTKYWNTNVFSEWYRPLKPDATLTISGAAADAKAVGDMLNTAIIEKDSLPANTDLNTFTDIGLYRIPSGNSVIPTLVNYPSSNPGRLLVLSDENGYFCTQVVITSTNTIFTRVQTSVSNHTWTEWASYDETVVRSRSAIKNENDRYDADLTLTNGVYSVSPATASNFDHLPSEYAGVLLVFGGTASKVQIYINRYGTVYYRFKYWNESFFEWYRPLKPDTTLSLAGAAADAKAVGDVISNVLIDTDNLFNSDTVLPEYFDKETNSIVGTADQLTGTILVADLPSGGFYGFEFDYMNTGGITNAAGPAIECDDENGNPLDIISATDGANRANIPLSNFKKFMHRSFACYIPDTAKSFKFVKYSSPSSTAIFMFKNIKITKLPKSEWLNYSNYYPNKSVDDFIARNEATLAGYVHDGSILRMSENPESIPVNEDHYGYIEFINATWNTLLPNGYTEGDYYNASTTKIHNVNVERVSRWMSTPYGENVDTYPIYRYMFTPQNGYNKTLFLTSGCHGNEAEGYWSLYRLIRMIYFEGYKYPTLRNLKDCRLIIVPSWNPWGMQHYRRYNAFSALNTGGTDVAKRYQAWAWLMADDHKVSVNGVVYDISEVGEANVIWETLQEYGDSINLWLDLHTDPYAGRNTTNVDIDDPRGNTPPYGCYGFSCDKTRGYARLCSVMDDFYNILRDEYSFNETWHPQATNTNGNSLTGWMAQFGFPSGVIEISTFMNNFPYASGSAGMMKLAQEYYGNCITEMLR